jgi:CubicO group peptidase (beta-lactamase class C family)
MGHADLMHLLRVALFLGVTIGWTLPSPPAFAAEAAAAASHPLSAADLEAFLDPLMKEQLARHKIAGAVVVVAKDDAILFSSGYGWADVERQRPMMADATLVRPASISKLFTGIAVMQLVEQDRLDLDRDVNDYLDFRIPTPAGGVPVTLRRLMTHRAGFEEHVKDLFSAAPLPQPLGPWLAHSLPRRLFPKGDVSAYSNYGMALAGYIVERTSGRPYADYVADHILGPLGMTHSTFRQPLPESLAPLMAKSYGRSDQPPWPFFETVTAAPAGALSATGADMGRFMLALLHGGGVDGARVLSEASLARMMAPAITTPTGSMGLVFYEMRYGRTRFVEHSGQTMSFFSDLLVSPESGLGLFVSFDGEAGEPAMSDLLRHLAERYLPDAAPQSFAGRRQDAEAAAGVYQTTHRADSTVVRLRALGSEILVRPTAEGISMSSAAAWPFGAEGKLHEAGPLVFGDDPYKFGFEPGPGHTMRLDIGPPIEQWQRVPWWLDARLVLPVVTASVLIAVVTLLSWMIAVARRWRRAQRWSDDAAVRRCHLIVRLVLVIQLVVIVSTAVVFAVGTENNTILNSALDPILILIYGLAWLGVFGGFAALWVAWLFWRKRIGTWWARLHHALIAVSAGTLAWFLLTWHLAGTTLNY